MAKYMDNRLLWIDTLRAIGIFFVVLVHTGRIDSLFILLGIKSFFMPLFFFLSGLFVKESFYKDSFFNILKMLAKRLLIPYIFFALVSCFFWLFLLRYFKNQPFDFLKSLLGILYSSGSGNWISYNGALWFFTCLFVVQVIFYFIFRVSHQKSNVFVLPLSLFCLSILGYIATTYVTTPSGRLPWSIDIALTATVFYGVGYLLQPYILTDLFLQWRCPVIFASLILYIFFTAINTGVEFYVGIYGNYLYFYIAAFSGILFWTHLAYLIRPNHLFSVIGQNTLVIFPTHLLVIPCLTGFLIYVLHIPQKTLENNTLIALGYAIFSILVILPISKIMNNYTPFLLGKTLKKLRVEK
jgi:acyltransferase